MKTPNQTTDGELTSKLRNYDLTVDEIKLVKTIDQKRDSLHNIQSKDPNSTRITYLAQEIARLEKMLEELQENTLIRF